MYWVSCAWFSIVFAECSTVFAPLYLILKALEYTGSSYNFTRVRGHAWYEEGLAPVQTLPWTCWGILCLLTRTLLHEEQLVSRSQMRAISITYEVTEQESVCFAALQILNARMTFEGRREDTLKVVLAKEVSNTTCMIWQRFSLQQIF